MHSMNQVLILIVVSVLCQVGICNGDYTADNESTNLIKYSFDVYRSIYNGHTNQVFSPLSFRVVYSVLYQTAFGRSERLLQNHLYYGYNITNKLQLVEGQTAILSRILASPKVKAANKVYLKNQGHFKSNINALVSRYHAGIEQVDFSRRDDVARNINKWVEEQTNGLITDLVKASSITSLTQLFIVNTLYFKANWSSPFRDTEVRDHVFYGIENEKTIKFINKKADYKVTFNDELQADVLELPYTRDSGYVFWILLPRQTSSLDQMVSNLNSDFMQKCNNKLEYQFVDLRFPIFETESEIDGKQITPDIFGVSEFDVLENVDPLEVTEIQQKTKIIVNTQGTEAAAATQIHLSLRSGFFLVGPQPAIFHANRPFVYAILTADKKEPIFVGHYAQP